MMDLLGRVQRCYDYIRELEEERKKIEAFQRELPLCLQLVTQAIESVRQQMGDDGRVNDGPVLEEFIPLKPSSTSASSEDRSEAEKSATTMAAAAGSDMKPDWLRSVQLWNQEPDTVIKVEKPKKPIAVSLKKMGGAFQPFERGKVRVTPPPAASGVLAATSTTSGGGGDGDGGDGSGGGGGGHHRKARRCWSAELHRRFLHALQQLGGSHVATPKQIRELMKVDGLTNDEVKSHLQKYRLHTRRPNLAVQSSSNNCPPAPQFVLVGGILVPPPDYAAAAAAAQPGNGACAPSSGIYAPVASLPSDLRLQHQQQQNGRQSQRSTTGPSSHSEGRCSGEEDSIGDDDDDNVANSNSPTTSASSQTTTSSPPF